MIKLLWSWDALPLVFGSMPPISDTKGPKMINKSALFALILSGVASGAIAQTPTDIVETWEADRAATFEASTVNVDDLVWVARVVVVFADTPNDPAFRQQMDLLADKAEDLAERDVIIVTDTDPAAQSELRTRLRPRGFSMVLIGKDGEVKLRKPAPWDVREISRSIDKMPLRQQEVVDRRREP